MKYVLLMLASLAVVACNGEPEGQEWFIAEVDEGTPAIDMNVPDEVDMGTVPEPDMAPPMLLGDSAPCSADAECAGGTCIMGDFFPNGFCTTAECATGATCAAGSTCQVNRNGTSYCAPDCTSDESCSEDLACRADFRTGERRCLPIRGAADGEACADRSDCQGRVCVADVTGGYCTSFCETSADCANLREFDNVCVQTGQGGFCVRHCAGPDDCRENHICTDLGGGDSACVEDPSRPFDESVFEPSALNIQCGIPVVNGIAEFSYEVAPTTTSYMITPMARDGQPIAARRITLPDMTTVNFGADLWFLTYPAELYSSMNPTMVPMSPNLAYMVAPGTNEYTLGAEGTELCYYLLEKEAPGDTLDLNVYLAGIAGVTAANAGADPNFIAVFDEVNRIYGQVGIQLGTIRFFDMDEAANLRFGVLRNDGEVSELVKLSKAPGTDIASLLSVNVFFVGEFAVRGGVIGISSGLPGPAGLHGTQGSGVVFTAEYMGSTVPQQSGPDAEGNAYTGLLLAHEVGHWLGLHHTIQISDFDPDVFTLPDPLDDTAACALEDALSADGRTLDVDLCPDRGNLMFPLAGNGTTEVTVDQGFVLKANPVLHTTQGVTP